MPPQEHEPLLDTGVNSSSWTQQNSTPAAAFPQQQQSSFAPAAHGVYPQLPFSPQVQQDVLLSRGPPESPLQHNSTAPYPIPSTSTSSHNPPQQQQQQQQQQPGWLGLPPPPNRYPSYGCSLHHSCSISTVDLCSSFDSMSLGSSTPALPAAKRYGSAGSTDTVDVLSQRYPSCGSTGAAAGDAVPTNLGHSSYYPLAPQLSAQQQQQQGRALRYPSIDSSGRMPSGAWGASAAAASEMNGLSSSRADSVSSTSSSGNYPAVPGVCSSFASRVGSGVSDVLQPHLLDSWEDADAVQQQQQQVDVKQQQQHKLSLREKLRHPRRSSGLYPVLSEEEAGPQKQQQQQQQLQDEPKEVAPWGYDLQVQIQQLSGLPAVADPYVMVLVHLAGHDEQYRTDPQWSTQQVLYGADEAFDLANIQPGCTLRCEVWDKNLLEDDMIGRGTWSFSGDLQSASTAGGKGATAASTGPADVAGRDQGPSWGAASDVTLELQHPTRSLKQTGKLQIKVSWRPSQQEGCPRRVGPVRFRQHYCPTAGMVTGQWSSDESMCYSTYKLFLCHISSVFQGVRMRWNADYDKARMIFQPVPVLGTPVAQVIKQQHSAMYATQTGPSRGGVLRCAGDFFKQFNHGIRGGESRFFTYTLCSDCFRCSETGTNFGTDMMSKHAMHAGGAEEVMYAGEFCIMKCDAAADGYKLVLDNNSGTYSPHKSKLPLLRQLFTLNFPDMEVEVLDWRDPKLGYYQSLCPSRAAAAAAAAVTAAVAAAATCGGKAKQFVAG